MNTEYNPRSFADLPDLIKELFVGQENRVRFGIEPSEMQILPSGLQVFSVRNDRKSKKVFGDVENLIHEMCHFVEIEESRMHKPGFGFNFPTFETRFTESQNKKMRDREMRITALQCNVLEHIADRKNRMYLHIEAEILLIVKTSTPRKDTDSSIYEEPDQEILDNIRKEISDMRSEKQFSFESFKEEWFRRIKIVDEIEKSQILEKTQKGSRFAKLVEPYGSNETSSDVIYVAATTKYDTRAIGAVLVRNGTIIERQTLMILTDFSEEHDIQQFADHHAILLGMHIAMKHQNSNTLIQTNSAFAVREIIDGSMSEHASINALRHETRNLLKAKAWLTINARESADTNPALATAEDLMDGFGTESREYNPNRPLKAE